MNNENLAVGTRLRYTGKLFEGFDPQVPQAVFLGYDSNSWTGIWINYRGVVRFVSLSDIEVDKPLTEQ
ncbi:hypothetical protein LX99_00969 [Mucilaginibacter oryzae]|uniref:CAP-Gly domain-containing protein n=2 Tax=Mucilaginibacter oryzae TaxID=468058 RepID=A0A316HKG5_9SPHI|nr:hypothetical protein LX99_00969 [Mucilaginibacter oryzae]